MCRKASCDTCGKSTWFGCGNHIEGVMSNIPTEDWCTCAPKVEREGVQYPPKGSMQNTTCQVG
ncbi:hypothetical protein BS50DRAFT_498423 [Corynespora cassiicola Philippines]|uniref:Uncharacterized protein n=1 Tax=Corynespora cassiicola Philippines TaxID=1448308 RepID=A0A2T2NHW2_CORCC|nr:hypothetical protein BS50DRAFT_498423 [Corynespora cassiicola Philippines]